jgi:Protein kinase domain
MYKFSGDDTITVTISGNISLREIIDMVNVQFSDRNVLVNGVEKSACDVNFGAGDIIVRSSPFMHEKDVMKEMQEKKGKEHIVTPSEPLVLEKEENKEKKEKEDGEEEEETGLEILALRNKKISELEKTTERALNSVQTFQRQHQVLYDRFVSLRVMFDEQKLSLLNTLWIHCGAYHPELSEIPKIENMAIFTESEDRVGEYTVGETLGQGQFATVRSCCKDGTSYELAVKIIKKDRFTTFTALKRISNEIEILRKLKSEFIVSVNDVVQTMDNLYIVTEKGGRDLFEYFYGSPDGVPESWAKEIITCVLKAVLYCHDRDICHRGESVSLPSHL